VSGWNRPITTERIGADGKIWFVSDLHLGDGTPSDAFFGKDRLLMALCDTVEDEGATLVIGGDAVDFQQAWSFTRILRAHQELFATLSRLGRDGRLFYVVGNHDYDLSLYKEMLNFRVCDELIIGDDILVEHGYQYDPFIKGELVTGQVSTKVHHLVERYLDTWLRIPLGEFYTLPNRFAFWLAHKVALATWGWAAFARLLGFDASYEESMKQLDFWARSNMGDPMCIFRPIQRRLAQDKWKYIVCGHSHLPGIVPNGDRAYVNTGSWTFASSHYVVWDGKKFSCNDWISGRAIGAEYYQPLLDGTVDEKDFWQWWRENYMGLLRFREGEERLVRSRGWESYLRDYQHLSVTPAIVPTGLRSIRAVRQEEERVRETAVPATARAATPSK